MKIKFLKTFAFSAIFVLASATTAFADDMMNDYYSGSNASQAGNIVNQSANAYGDQSNNYDDRTMQDRLDQAQAGVNAAQGNLNQQQATLNQMIQDAQRMGGDPDNNAAIARQRQQVAAAQNNLMQQQRVLRHEQRVAGNTAAATNGMADQVNDDLNATDDQYQLSNGPDSVNRGAQGAKGQEMIGALMSAAAAAMLFSMCGPQNPMPCALGALAAAQAGMMMATAGQTQSDVIDPTMASYGTSGTDYQSPNSSNANNTNGEVAAAGAQARNILAALAKKGYKVSADGSTVTLPDGTQVPASALSSPGKMKEFGFSDRDVASATDALGKAKANAARVGAVGVAEGGGGRKSGYIGAAANGKRKYNYGKFGKKKAKRNIASVAGMKKKFGNEMIGVATDNIFKMVRRRYDKKRKGNFFIEAK